MKKIFIIILAVAAFATGCTPEDVVNPVTPPQPEQPHVRRIYEERHMVFEVLNPATEMWDTVGQMHEDKKLFMEWFWNGDRLDSIIQYASYAGESTYRFTYDDKGVLTRYEQFINGYSTGGYVLFYYDADGHLSKFEKFIEDTLFSTGTIDSYVGDKISHMIYKDLSYDIDINYIHDGDNVSEMVVEGILNDRNLRVVYSYIHDDSPNPYGFNLFNIVSPREPYRWMSANNVLIEFARSVEGDTEERDTRTEYVYRYENDLPVEISYESTTGTYESRMKTTTKEYYEY